MLNIIMFGSPGAGKGTQSKMLLEHYNLTYISTGELLRKEIKENTAIGRKIKDVIEAGGLADDEIIVKLIERTIREHQGSDGFLFDGFPRTYVQAYILDGLFLRLQRSLTRIFILEISNEEATRRMLQRAKDLHRTDDNEIVIKRRLEEYQRKTLPLLEFYKNSGLITTIPGYNSADETFTHIKQYVDDDIRKKNFNVVMIGYPGAGMTTQAQKLAEEFNLTCFSTREILQQEVDANSDIGKQIQPYMEKGLLLPDEVVIKLIEKKLLETHGNSRGYVFKGYPRTLVQAYILDGILKKMGQKITCVVNLKVSYLELMKRLAARGKTSRAMPYDSTAESIVARLEEHELRSGTVLEYYSEHYQVIDIDGTGSIEEVYQRLSKPVLNASRNLR